jgi:hypothetical protein
MAKLFSKALMASEDIKSFVGSTLFQSAGANAPITNGAFVVLGNLASDATYSSTGVDDNLYLSTAPAAATASVVVVDLASISEGTIDGNVYKMGNRLYDLTAPAGVPARFRRLMVGDKFWLADGNFGVGTPTVGQYGVLTAGAVTLTAQSSQGANFAVIIRDKKSLTTGQIANGSLYLCEVVAL